jgi:hypothetical protein
MSLCWWNSAYGKAMTIRTRLTTSIFSLLLFSTSIRSIAGSCSHPQNQPATDSQTQTKVVYVCACLKTKSCFCMTEAKMEGPCACGTEGGPPMKAVPPDSAWAKQNREALAKK